MVNKAIILGNLGQDPKTKEKDDGDNVCYFSVATNYTKKNGEQETDWHQVSCFGKQADLASKHLKKGHLVFVEGPIKQNSWLNEDGEKRYKKYILCHKLVFCQKNDSSEQY